jgi:glyoxylase-like metal-dependent hydrolase (beta-lactamase superfamily II)
MKVETVTLGSFATNCYLVWSDASASALLVDCAGEAEPIIQRAQRLGLAISLIVTTHGHIDHVEALADLKRITGAPIAVHELDAPMLSDTMASGAAMFGLSQQSVTPDIILGDGKTVGLTDDGLTFEVLHTPGHTPGSICLLGQGALFSGDCLFAGGIGRVDLPGGDERAILRSLERLAGLDPSLLVYPGHGPATTIGAEVANNPWLTELI